MLHPPPVEPWNFNDFPILGNLLGHSQPFRNSVVCDAPGPVIGRRKGYREITKIQMIVKLAA